MRPAGPRAADGAVPGGDRSLGRAVRAAADRLAGAGVGSPRVDAELLAAHATGLTRSALSAAILRGAVLTPDRGAAFDALVGRRTAREPLQHLTGKAGFRRLDLAVGPGVFVPRPETEMLAGWAIEVATGDAATVGGSRDGAIVVDLCTGSGAIAAAVADEVPGARVVAVELDPPAHAWAVRNLAGTGVDLLLGDATTLDRDRPDLVGLVDVVVANPPYIPLDAWESVAPEVRDHDPVLALWGGQDGLDVVRGVVTCAARLLRAGGQLGVEHADAQGSAVPDLLAATGAWVGIRDHEDLSGRSRWTTARRAPGDAKPLPGTPGAARSGTMSR